MRSRQALTTIRCSQVVTAASPRKDPARRNAAIMPSWRPSAASSGLPMVRSATAHSRSRCRREQLAERVGVAVDVRAQQLGVGRSLVHGHSWSRMSGRPQHRHLGDLAAEPALDRRAARSATRSRSGRRRLVER